MKLILVQEDEHLKTVSVSHEIDIEQFAKENFVNYLIVEDSEIVSETEEPWKISDGVLLKRPKLEAVPSFVTIRQARLALLQRNLLPHVQVAIDSLPSPQKEAAQIEWEYSSEIHRDKPFVQLLGAAMDLSNEQLDDLFILASKL